MTEERSRLDVAAAWFVRACSLLVAVLWGLGIRNHGWSRDFRSFSGLSGIIGATMLCLLSFTFVTTGRTKKVVAVATIVLALWIVVFSAAGLLFP